MLFCLTKQRIVLVIYLVYIIIWYTYLPEFGYPSQCTPIKLNNLLHSGSNAYKIETRYSYSRIVQVSMNRIPKPNIEDIVLFYPELLPKLATNRTDGRLENGSLNIRREGVIACLDSPSYTLADSVDITPNHRDVDHLMSKWHNLHAEFRKVVAKLSPFPEYTFTVEPQGGRKQNYDFDFIYRGRPDVSLETGNLYKLKYRRKIEFKHCQTHSPRIVSLPQIYQRPCATTRLTNLNTTPEFGYPAFYYTHYLPRIWSMVPALAGTELPSVEEYIRKTNSACPALPAIQEIKDYTKTNVSVKDAINKMTNESISRYIESISTNIDINEVSRLIGESQSGKTYLLWSKGAFYVDQIPEDELVIREVSRTTNNTVVFRANTLEYHFLLRWKNGKGITNPAWQISVKQTKND